MADADRSERQRLGRPRNLPSDSVWMTREKLEEMFEKRQELKKRKMSEKLKARKKHRDMA